MVRFWKMFMVVVGVLGPLTGPGELAGQSKARKPDPPDRAQVMQLAEKYTFVNRSTPIDAANPLPPENDVPSAAAPTDFAIERAVPNASPAPTPLVILARVHSNAPYPPLGVGEGDNYIWRDQSSSNPKRWVTYMVPVDPKFDLKRLKRARRQYSDGDHSEPRLVHRRKRAAMSPTDAFGACLEDPACGTGHCGYAGVY